MSSVKLMERPSRRRRGRGNLRWSPLPAVDLLEECHWLVDMDAS
ncbi:hypothetical protein PC114_g5421 [Phytophthora cactorum]|nr:hypothetical protein PC114_g5421 [Phytophthora cactorum]KAG3184943.1 hypothetical protein PC128_g13518 [Phytophthora cactorum]